MAKAKKEKNEIAEQIINIINAKVKEMVMIQGELSDSEKERDLTETEKVKALKDYFNSIEVPTGGVEEKIYSIVFNPTERDTEKVKSINNLIL